MKREICRVVSLLGLALLGQPFLSAQSLGAAPPLSLAERTAQSLAQHNGSLSVLGLHHPVQVLRDPWGIPHIYAEDTHDLFFAQGFTVAQDHMWQMELWRRTGEGKLAQVLGPAYVQRDTFARLLAFHGDWNAEYRKYHPEGVVIFGAFAQGVNAAINIALEEQKIPIEFQVMGFLPESAWTAKTVLTRMPAWTLSHNASTELARALAIKAYGIEKAQQLIPTAPEKKIEIPADLSLDDISAQILDLARNANSLAWKFNPDAGTKRPPGGGGGAASTKTGANGDQRADSGNGVIQADSLFDLGSNNWVVGGSKSATGMPLLANDPHREVVNPALRTFVHLVAPGWNDIGATEPGLPGISIGHNENIAWGFTILGVDQQDIYVEETDAKNPDRYLYKGQWLTMDSQKQLIQVKGKPFHPVVVEIKSTMHGPVLYEDKTLHRAYSLRWVGSEIGGAGYLGSLNVMQAKNWAEFTSGVAKSWYLPSHSLVYADVKGNYGYMAAALSPVRKNWDGLLPVPGKDGKYEWSGFVPLPELPKQLNGSKGFYASANNDVVPKVFPKYKVPLGYEYSAPYRYDRIAEVLSQNKKFTIEDFEQLQQDHISLPARALVPLLKGLKSDDPDVQSAIGKLLAWDDNVDKNATTPTIYEYWLMKLTPLAYAPHLPAGEQGKVDRFDVRNVIAWMQSPGKEYGPDPKAGRNQILLKALQQALAELHQKFGDDESKWVWGDIHKATFQHPLLAESTKSVFAIDPVRRGGDAYTVQATSNPTEKGADETHGASAQFIMDVQDWDRSVALNTPGNSAAVGDPHSSDLAPPLGRRQVLPVGFQQKEGGGGREGLPDPIPGSRERGQGGRSGLSSGYKQICFRSRIRSPLPGETTTTMVGPTFSSAIAAVWSNSSATTMGASSTSQCKRGLPTPMKCVPPPGATLMETEISTYTLALLTQPARRTGFITMTATATLPTLRLKWEWKTRVRPDRRPLWTSTTMERWICFLPSAKRKASFTATMAITLPRSQSRWGSPAPEVRWVRSGWTTTKTESSTCSKLIRMVKRMLSIATTATTLPRLRSNSAWMAAIAV